MNTTLTKEQINGAISFHGHNCPGISFGIRAAEQFFCKKNSFSFDEEIVCITETDMCGVDAIQYLIGCTFGKGNLIFKDYGKKVFTFYNRNTGKSLRVALKTSFVLQSIDFNEKIEEIMNTSLEAMFETTEGRYPVPEKAKVMKSIVCEICHEKVMESRIKNIDDKYVCIPCSVK